MNWCEITSAFDPSPRVGEARVSKRGRESFSGNDQPYGRRFFRKRLPTPCRFQRKRLGLLLDDRGGPLGGKWSFDAENRKRLPRDVTHRADLAPASARGRDGTRRSGSAEFAGRVRPPDHRLARVHASCCCARSIRQPSIAGSWPWCAVWDALYWRFIDRHHEWFAANPRMSVMVAQRNRMGERLNEHLQTADRFLNRLHG
jgi:deoxyribodipyrimidine photolyase-like uncharacterized protein